MGVDRVKEIIAMNEAGQKPEDLKAYMEYVAPAEESYASVDGQDSLSRFDEKKGNRKRKKRSGNRNPNAHAKTDQKAGSAPKKSRGPRPEANADQPKSNRTPNSGNQSRRKPRPKK
jgi:hypothetical protein